MSKPVPSVHQMAYSRAMAVFKPASHQIRSDLAQRIAKSDPKDVRTAIADIDGAVHSNGDITQLCVPSLQDLFVALDDEELCGSVVFGYSSSHLRDVPALRRELSSFPKWKHNLAGRWIDRKEADEADGRF